MKLEKIRHKNNSVSWTITTNNSLEVVESAREWIVHLEQCNYSPNTIEAYARHLAKLGSFLSANNKNFLDINIRDYEHFLDWLSHLKDQEKVNEKLLYIKDRDIKKLSPSLKNQIHLAVKSYYRFCNSNISDLFESSEVANYYGEQNYLPFLNHINQKRTTRKKDRYLHGNSDDIQRNLKQYRLKPEEILKIIKSCNMFRDSFLIVLLYNTGMRIGEALGLRHEDIDLNDKVIWIVPRQDNENGARAKSNKVRAIPVLSYVIDMYEDYCVSDEYIQAFEMNCQYVFCNLKNGKIGKALSRSNVYGIQAQLKKRSRVHFHWHMFRHSHASEAIAQGYNLLTLSDRLGHSSPQTTLLHYKHLYATELRMIETHSMKGVKKGIDDLIKYGHLNPGSLKWI